MILDIFFFQFDITKEPVVVVIVSTTGDGEPPDTVSKYAAKYGVFRTPKAIPFDRGALNSGRPDYRAFRESSEF